MIIALIDARFQRPCSLCAAKYRGYRRIFRLGNHHLRTDEGINFCSWPPIEALNELADQRCGLLRYSMVQFSEQRRCRTAEKQPLNPPFSTSESLFFHLSLSSKRLVEVNSSSLSRICMQRSSGSESSPSRLPWLVAFSGPLSPHDRAG
jgi:hypothetical protein